MNRESTLGAYLRQAREKSGLSTEDISTGSRIVPRLVSALEADRHDLLPAPVYVRGFIRTYCDLVGADPEEALQLYGAAAIPDPPLTVRPTAPPRAPAPPPRGWLRAAVGSLLAAAFGVAAIVLLARRHPDADAGRESDSTIITAQSTAPDLAAPPSSSAVVDTPQAEPAAPEASASVERVLLMRAVDTTWVRVTPDGAPPTEAMLTPGTVREWRSAGRFHVTVGNAGGVEIELDGQALPALGKPGQVVRNTTIPSERPP